MGLARISPNVLVSTSSFASMTSGVVCGDDGTAILVDPGVTVEELSGLAAEVEARGLRVVAGVATHGHWDHVLWHPSYGPVPRYAHPAAIADVAARLPEVDREARLDGPGEDEGVAALVGRGLVALAVSRAAGPQGFLPWPGRPCRVLAHRGHAPGHLALLVEPDGVLFAGDMLSDVEIPLLDLTGAAPLTDYAEGLDTLARVLPSCRVLVPGHGSVTDGAGAVARSQADRAYLESVASLAVLHSEDADAAILDLDVRLRDRDPDDWMWRAHRQAVAAGRSGRLSPGEPPAQSG